MSADEMLPRETGEEKLPEGHYRTPYGSIVEAGPAADPIEAEVNTEPDEREKAAEIKREIAIEPGDPGEIIHDR